MARGADHPGGDTIDAGVEIIQPDVHAAKKLTADNFFGDGPQVVGHHAPRDRYPSARRG